jgi:hypothetical protein
MKLFEHKDFGQAVLAAEQHFQSRGLHPAIIEKDYYVTEGRGISIASWLHLRCKRLLRRRRADNR